MELRLKIDDDFIEQIGKKLGTTTTKATEIAREALTMYKWAVDEAANGRVVLSSDTEGTDIHKLVMHNLETLRAKSANISSDKNGKSDNNATSN